MECHHYHSGNRILIFNLPLRLVSRCFLAASRSQSIQDWPGFDLLNFSLIEVRREVPALAIVVSCLKRADALLQRMFTPDPSWSSVCSVVPSAQVVTVELLVWPTGSWHVRVQDTKNLDLLNGTPSNGLSSSSLLRLHFQSSLGSITLWKVYLCNAQPKEYSLQCRVTQQVKSIILV